MKNTRVITFGLVLAATLACGRKKQPDTGFAPPTKPEQKRATLRTARMPISLPFALMKGPKV